MENAVENLHFLHQCTDVTEETHKNSLVPEQGFRAGIRSQDDKSPGLRF